MRATEGAPSRHPTTQGAYRLDGLSAVVTGSSGEIGGAIAKQLAAQGASLVVNGRREAEAMACAEAIASAGGRAVCVAGDMADRDVALAAERAAVELTGALDIVVSNIGGRAPAPFHDVTDSQWQSVLTANLMTYVQICRVAVPRMMSKRYGRIISVSSLASSGVAGQANYVAAKSAVEGLTRALSAEYAAHGITANCVSLGYMDTAKIRSRMRPSDEESVRQAVARIPAGRLGSASDIAGVVGFLASAEAGYISGEVLRVAGGLTTAALGANIGHGDRH